MLKFSMMTAALVLGMTGLTANSAFAAGYECTAIASASAPRTTPRPVSGTGATLQEARKAALSACSSTAAPAASCNIIRCNVVR